MILIGDTHGKTERLARLVQGLPSDKRIIQLGDMGLGFSGVFLPHLGKNFSFIRGNHDDPAQCRMHPNYLGDYGFLPEEKAFYLAGAWSIDWKHRVPGVSWWFDEEMSVQELDKAVALYKTVKPEITLSHEAPSSAVPVLLDSLGGGYFEAKGECKSTRTSQALEQMFIAHQPKHWIFGHYHIDKDFEINGTHFRCCAELSTYEVNL